ncbi:hypothetical protein ACFQHN_00280 [Natrialbaceae archaeon GCM10025896]
MAVVVILALSVASIGVVAAEKPTGEYTCHKLAGNGDKLVKDNVHEQQKSGLEKADWTCGKGIIIGPIPVEPIPAPEPVKP